MTGALKYNFYTCGYPQTDSSFKTSLVGEKSIRNQKFVFFPTTLTLWMQLLYVTTFRFGESYRHTRGNIKSYIFGNITKTDTCINLKIYINHLTTIIFLPAYLIFYFYFLSGKSLRNKNFETRLIINPTFLNAGYRDCWHS